MIFTKSKKITIILLLAIIYFCGRYVVYGSLIRSCIYTETILPVPSQLIGKELVVVQKAAVLMGRDEDYSCLMYLGDRLNRKILGPNYLYDTYLRKYYTDKGFFFETLEKDLMLQVVGMAAVTKHGISTIDSGPGPLYYLILRDKSNRLYKVATVYLGLREEEMFLFVIDPSNLTNNSSGQLLGWKNLDGAKKYLMANQPRYKGQYVEAKEG